MRVSTQRLNSSPTYPAVLSWLIVARDQPELYRVLQQGFGSNPQIGVILDRRWADRRLQAVDVLVDRRWRERRSLPGIEEDLHLRQYILARPRARRPQDWRLTPDR